MQLRKMAIAAVLGAVVGFVAGCPDEPTPAGNCSADSDCATNEICHPTAKQCVQTCSSGSDCPDTAKNCAALNGSSTKICQCATDVLCNGGANSGTSDKVCSTVDKICETKCTSSSDCAGRTCDTATGQCQAGSSGGDGGTDGGVGQSCTGTGQTTCTYGQFCSSGTCALPETPTCQNYTSLADKSGIGTTGPIIFNATSTASTDTNFCGNTGSSKRVKITLQVYTSGTFPSTKDQLNGFFYVDTDGNPISAVSTVSSSSGNYTVTESGHRADIVVSLCRPDTSNTTLAGFYFTGGNFFCHRANY